MLLEQLDAIKQRFFDVELAISSPDAVSDRKRFAQLNREYKDLKALVDKADEYRTVVSNLEHARQVVQNEKDEEFREMARLELDDLSARSTVLEEEIRQLLLPADPEDTKDAILEIRAGTGGDEASLLRATSSACTRVTVNVVACASKRLTSPKAQAGGFKEVILNIHGDSAYGILKYESGVHRVQRVPATETQGRIHTSAATVVVLPEADEFDVDIKANDIRKDLFCSSGPGGQSVNTTYSAVRLTPSDRYRRAVSGRKITDQELREGAIRASFTHLRDGIEQATGGTCEKRKTMVSTGDRSAKIRTYNYPQSRVTDHRIGMTVYNLQAFVDGDIQDMIDALQVAENAERMKEGNG